MTVILAYLSAQCRSAFARLIHQYELMYGPRMTAPTAEDRTRPPEFLSLAGHPLRWLLLTELAQSDRRVRELVRLTGARQNLVSYHLRRLRASALVNVRRSSASGRDVYYAANLERFAALLRETGQALHPGLQLVMRSAAFETDSDSAGRAARVRVLFLCTGNSARSQMAEAMMRGLANQTVQVASAGSHPKQIHPNAVRVMSERGIDLSGHRAKHLNEFLGSRFDYVITLCDRVREVCPEFPGHPRTIHWSIPDPSRSPGNDTDTYSAFEAVAEELATRIRIFTQALRPDVATNSRIVVEREGCVDPLGTV